MSDGAASDAAARESALDVTRSFIVQAPAGSGKTTVLTQRYLKLLAHVDEPEQVLAITFTRKAAGEMRERVAQALEGTIAVRTDADRVTLELAAQARERAQARGWGLEDSAARLKIQTIDAFNGHLARSLPLTSRSAFQLRISDAPRELYALAARDAMRTAERDPDFRLAFELVQRRLDNQWHQLEALLAGMLPRRAEWLPNLAQLSGLPMVPRVEAALQAIVTEELGRIAAAIRHAVIEDGQALARVAAPKLPEGDDADARSWEAGADPLEARIEHLARWRGLAWFALTEGKPRQKLDKRHGVVRDDAQACALRDRWVDTLATLTDGEIAAFAALARLPDPQLLEDQRRALDALAQMLLLAAVSLKDIFATHGECDHTEVAGYARQALTEDSSPTPLAERLGARLMHILVDEFQDTSREQFDLLRTLTYDWSEGDGRTLFLVGDPMQSIYGFRNAEVGRFATVREGGLAREGAAGNLPLETLELRRNFRSAPAIVGWCNEVFARVFPAEDDARSSAVRHLTSVAARTALDVPAPCVHRIEGPDAAALEAVLAVDLIAGLRRERPGESVGVLASTRGQLHLVRRELVRRGIPCIGIKLEPLAQQSVVRDLEALARAVDSPLDRIAWLSVLRGPLVGLALPDLTRIAAAAGQGTILAALLQPVAQLSADAVARLARAVPMLFAAWAQREREPWAQRIERVWLTLGGPACIDAAGIAHARDFFAALDAADAARQRGSLPDIEAMMADLYAAEESADENAVSLMTIHGAKGLEFDHVLIPGIGRRGRPEQARLLNWLELPRAGQADDLLMAPIRISGSSDEDDDRVNSYLSFLHRERARAERSRLAYVALTRARRSLHLFVHPVRRKNAETLSADPSSMLHNLWPALGAMVEAAPAAQSRAAPVLAITVTQTRHRLPAQVPAPSLPPDVVARGEFVPLGQDDDVIEFSWVRQTARRIGTVVHEVLERFGRDRLPTTAEFPRLRVRLESRLQSLGVEGAAARAGAERALEALRAMLDDERGRWLLARTHAQASSELALSGVEAGRIVNAVIDRTFVADGIRWVVDFKTSPHEGGDLSAFLDAEVQRYSGQLNRYARLARGLGPEPVRAGLYYPLLAAWREVPLET